MLAIVLPLFLKWCWKDATLEVVASQNLSEQFLQAAVMEFLATWRSWAWAGGSDSKLIRNLLR